MYMTDAAQSSSDIEKMRKAMRDTKGLGNFRNLFMYAPNGKKDGIQIIPLSEVATKDDFFNIKKATRDDLLSAHRVPPQMMGIIPDNAGGFGDVEKAAQVFVRNELTPLQERMKELNDWIGKEVIRFKPYELSAE
jgi:PBSX family phage portal protein